MQKKVHRHGRLFLAAILLSVCAPATASAVHWPFFGGDAGRSGNQPVGDGTPPVRALYSSTDPGDQNVQTSVLATDGAARTRRLAYGTRNGAAHLRVLESGAAVGPAAGIGIDDGVPDADVFGPPPAAAQPGSVSFVDTSGPAGLGQLLVVHNDDDQSERGDIAIAQVDESTGALVKQVPLEGTNGFSIRSSPVASAADSSDARVIFFVAENGDDERLFRVPVASASSTSASFGEVTSTGDINAQPEGSPALVWLRDPAGQPRGHVAVGSGAPDARVKTFGLADLTPGPVSGDLGDELQTPSVPVRSDGSTPGPGGGAATAPALYVAARTGDASVVHRLIQSGNEQGLTTAASSPPLAGAPAPALATDVESGPTGPTPGRLVVTTQRNLYLLDGQTLAQAATFSASALAPGTGFAQTTAAVANGFVYVTTDDGAQLVLKLADAQPVTAGQFTENPVNAAPRPPKSGLGQPSVSRGFVQFAGAKGVFVYVNRCGNPVVGSEGPDRITGTPAGDQVLALGGNDSVSALDGDDCLRGGPGDDALSGNAGDDEVFAEAGDDRVYGRSGNDSLSGNEGADRISGGVGADLVLGHQGDDTLAGNSGEDTVRGGNDDDRVSGGTGDDALSGNAGDDSVSGGAGDDRVFGRTGDDAVSGNAGNDRVSGGPGNDTVFGRAGADAVSGNAGNDRVFGGPGRDRLFGRTGNDRIFARDGERDIVLCGPGRDTVFADRGDVLRGCERLFRR